MAEARSPLAVPESAVADTDAVKTPLEPWVMDFELPAPESTPKPPAQTPITMAAVPVSAPVPLAVPHAALAQPATDSVEAAPAAAEAVTAATPPQHMPPPVPPMHRPIDLPHSQIPPTDEAPLSAEDLEEAPARGRPWALYAVAGLAGVAVVGALAWWMLRGVPMATGPVAVAPSTATAPRTPDAEIITEAAEPPGAPAVSASAAEAAAVVAEAPVATTHTASASSAEPPSATPAPRPPPGTQAQAAPARAPRPVAPRNSNEPPWQHPGSRAPAPANLSGAGATPVPAATPAPVVAPAPAPDPLGPLRADLRQCDGEPNILSKGVCVVRARHRHCGSHWGKVPECPLSQRSGDPYNN